MSRVFWQTYGFACFDPHSRQDVRITLILHQEFPIETVMVRVLQNAVSASFMNTGRTSA